MSDETCSHGIAMDRSCLPCNRIFLGSANFSGCMMGDKPMAQAMIEDGWRKGWSEGSIDYVDVREPDPKEMRRAYWTGFFWANVGWVIGLLLNGSKIWHK